MKQAAARLVSRCLAYTFALAVLVLPTLSYGQAGPVGMEQIGGEWIGGLNDSGKRILAAAIEPAGAGVTLSVWQRTGDLYSSRLKAVPSSDSSRIELRGDDGSVLEGAATEGIIRAEVALPSRNIKGKIMLVRRGGDGNAARRYEGVWSEGFLGPESFYVLAAEAGRRGDTASALQWIERGRGAKRPLNDALTFSGTDLDQTRQLKRFREILHDPVAAHPELSQAIYRVRVDRGIRIRMRDGAHLVADIYRPDLEGRFPVILIRTPYNRGPDIPPGGVDHFAPRGYAVVIQSVRGREGSEGAFEPWLNERRDGYDSIDWASRQPWSDGNVGMMGLSYLGQAQWQAAVEAHPALKAIIPEVAGTDSFLDTPYDHGILRLDLLNWLRGMLPPEEARKLPPMDENLLTQLPLSELDQRYVGTNLPIWQRLLELDTSDRWASSNFLSDLNRVRIPALNISGWWDGEASSTTRNYRAMRDLRRTDQWIIYGPWEHVWNQSTRLRDQEYGSSAIIDFKSLAVRWFDQWLKHKPVGFEDVPKVQIFITGANEWQSFADWPPSKARPFDLFLAHAGPICGPQRKGALTRARSRCRAANVYVYDPAKVSPNGNGLIPDETAALNINAKAGDLLLYESTPFGADTTLLSPGSLDLWFSTSAHDADFFVLVYDMDEAGIARVLSGPGKMRMSYRNGYSKPSPLEPNRVYHHAIELRPFAHRFAKGHRVGILIRSDWFPSFTRNLNTGERIKGATRMEVGRISIFHDVRHASRLHLWALDSPRQK